jgi:hypothetical protein
MHNRNLPLLVPFATVLDAKSCLRQAGKSVANGVMRDRWGSFKQLNK